MEEVGKVVEVKGDLAMVEMAAKGACECCAARIICRPGGDKMYTEALNEAGAVTGQMVRVDMTPKSAMEAAFLLFIVPIGMLVLGLLLFRKFGSGELPGVLGGLLFLGLYFLVLRFLDKTVSGRRRYRPVVREIVSNDTPTESKSN